MRSTWLGREVGAQLDDDRAAVRQLEVQLVGRIGGDFAAEQPMGGGRRGRLLGAAWPRSAPAPAKGNANKLWNIEHSRPESVGAL